MFYGKLAFSAASLFSGAAFYVNFAEQPARLQLEPQALLAEWKPSYHRGFLMQASLAIIGGVAALCEFYATNSTDWRWFFGGVALLANWPYTLLVVMPINKKLMKTSLEDSGQATQELIVKWGYLHAVRTALGGTAVLLLFSAL